MSTDLGEKNEPPPARSRWQFSLRRMFVATTAVAVLLSLASWGGWVKSDAVVYLSIAVLAAVFSAAARQRIWARAPFWRASCLAGILRAAFLHPAPVRGIVDPEEWWIFSTTLVVSAGLMRTYTRASASSLLTSLALFELFMAGVAIYAYGCPTLFDALSPRHRLSLSIHFAGNFPLVEQWFIVPPWLAGIVAGEILSRRRKSGRGPS